MGAVIWIPVVLIVLAAIGFVLWTLFAAGRGAVASAQAIGDENTQETAAHSNERTKSRSVETTPPEDPAPPAEQTERRPQPDE